MEQRYYFLITWKENGLERTFEYFEEEDLEYAHALENALVEGGFGSVDEDNLIESVLVKKVGYDVEGELLRSILSYLEDELLFRKINNKHETVYDLYHSLEKLIDKKK